MRTFFHFIGTESALMTIGTMCSNLEVSIVKFTTCKHCPFPENTGSVRLYIAQELSESVLLLGLSKDLKEGIPLTSSSLMKMFYHGLIIPAVQLSRGPFN